MRAPENSHAKPALTACLDLRDRKLPAERFGREDEVRERRWRK
jgi:hypothetical protein